MRREYIQIVCDNCGQVIKDFRKGEKVNKILLDEGHIVAGYSHYCNTKCLYEHEKKK